MVINYSFSFDMRNNTKHWMTSELDEQASFYVNRTGRFTKSGVEIVQSYLQIKKVQWKDAGFYRCRVDFFQAPTRNLKVKLSLIGKASKFFSHSEPVGIGSSKGSYLSSNGGKMQKFRHMSRHDIET